jgi:hypothetical protein
VIMIEDIIKHTSPRTVGAALLAVLILWKLSQWLTVEMKIRALGGHAPKIRTWLPWGTFSSSSLIQ